MRRRLLIGFILILLVAKVIGVVARGPSPIVLDASGYWDLGQLVSQGDVLLYGDPIAYRTPAYPWMLALVDSLPTPPLLTLVCLQGAMWVATIAIVAVMAVDITRKQNAGWWAVGIACFMISSVIYISTTLTETLFVFALVAHLWSVQRFVRGPSVLGAPLVGLTLALAILTRPVAMMVWVADAIYLLISWYWIHDSRAEHLCRKRGWICVGLAALTTFACLAPWLARNQAMFGKAMLTEFVGRNVWIVAFQDGSGSGYPMPESDSARELKRTIGEETWKQISADDSWRHTWTVANSLKKSGLDDASLDRLMKQVAFDAIKNDPTDYAKKTGRRLVNFWRTRATEMPTQFCDLPDIEAGNEMDSFKGQDTWGVKVPPIDTALQYRISNWLPANTLLMFLTAMATMLLIWIRETRATGFWMLAVLAYFTTVTSVLEIPAYRYRMIMEPIVLLVIACAIQSIAPGSTWRSRASFTTDKTA